MALLIFCGEVSPAYIPVLRFFNQSVDFVRDNVSKIFASLFTSSISNLMICRDFEMLLSAFEHPVSTTADCSQSNIDQWFSNKKDCDVKGYSEAVLSVLDTILKGNLERLRTMRENESWTKSLERDDSYCGSIIIELCAQGKLEEAMWLQKKMIQKDFFRVCSHNYLLNGLCKLDDMEKADKLIRKMMERGPSPNCVSYNTFIKGLCHTNNVDKALCLFATMGNYGVKPNRVTCNTIAHALCQRDILGNAIKLCEEILGDSKYKATSDLVTSTILMDTCFKKGDVVKALTLWEEMLQKNIVADSVVYNVLIRGFCLSRNMRAAYGFLHDMIKRAVDPDIFTYNTLISALCKKGKFDKVFNIRGIMSRVRVPPDWFSYKMIIQSLCKRGDLAKAKEFLADMLQNSMLPEALLWNVVIDGYARFGDLNNALSVRDQTLSYGVTLNVYTKKLVGSHVCERGNIIDAYCLKNQMLSVGIFPDVVTYIIC